jgi:arylsulfatase A-like enzyme
MHIFRSLALALLIIGEGLAPQVAGAACDMAVKGTNHLTAGAGSSAEGSAYSAEGSIYPAEGSVYPAEGASASAGRAKGIVHDAEYYILEAQNKKAWSLQDEQLDQTLATLRKKHGRPPNIIHLMWDDQPFGAVGIPAMQPMRGYVTPRLNQMAAEGILFTRMYSEPASTPTRSASLTGQHPVRNGMFQVGFPVGYRGMSADNVTIAEVLARAGYATGFFGKLHLGDIAQNYPHKQGFDEAFFALYDHAVGQWNEQGEAVIAASSILGQAESAASDPLDASFLRKGYVFYMEGQRGGDTLEWCGTSTACYLRFDAEAQRRTLAFIRSNAECGKPFYAAWWPLRNTLSRRSRVQHFIEELVGENAQESLDESAGALIDTLQELGLAENTLIIAMSANGPMIYKSSAGVSFREGPFRGGKGDYLEGGVRVSAQAWWPGVIAAGQVVNDMVHVTDLYATFARLAGASDYIPRDRIIDGIDQTALLFHGNGHSRRDYNFIYSGPELAAIVKQHYKIHWMPDRSMQAEGNELFNVYDLLHDHREDNPVLLSAFHFKEPFRRMRSRHEQWIKKYPHLEQAIGPAYTELVNARPETVRVSRGAVEFQRLPYDSLDFIKHELPFDPTIVPGMGE